jgi:tetratricopeptide (TPR) repeat protein
MTKYQISPPAKAKRRAGNIPSSPRLRGTGKNQKYILIFILCLLLSLYSLSSTLYSQGEEVLSSKELTIRAWEALAAKDYETAIFYADRCIEQYQEEAAQQQASLKDFPARGKEEQFWALNDVGASLFIKGEVFMKQKRWNEAREVFNKIINDYSFSQCWDPRGWFWKVAEISKVNLEKIAKAIEKEGSHKHE